MTRYPKKWIILLLVTICVAVVNRPNSFIPGWLKALFWHSKYPANVEFYGRKISIPLSWWIERQDSISISFSRAPQWNNSTQGMVFLVMEKGNPRTIESLKTLKFLGGDSVVSSSDAEINLSGIKFNGVRFALVTNDAKKKMSYETYTLNASGLLLNIINVPNDQRGYVSDLTNRIRLK